jgi:hypothetical protein
MLHDPKVLRTIRARKPGERDYHTIGYVNDNHDAVIITVSTPEGKVPTLKKRNKLDHVFAVGMLHRDDAQCEGSDLALLPDVIVHVEGQGTWRAEVNMSRMSANVFWRNRAMCDLHMVRGKWVTVKKSAAVYARNPQGFVPDYLFNAICVAWAKNSKVAEFHRQAKIR